MNRRALLVFACAWLAACVGQHTETAPKPPSTPAAPPTAASTEQHPGTAGGGPNEDFMAFLLIGQSNMEGAPKPEAEDQQEDPHVLVLAYEDCPALGRVRDRWYVARPPLHGCNAGVGPGDAFGKVVARAFPKATIGLVPSAISGVDIDFFRKGVVSKRRQEFRIPSDNRAPGAYEWVLARAKLA
jgi:hypothetical protein